MREPADTTVRPVGGNVFMWSVLILFFLTVVVGTVLVLGGDDDPRLEREIIEYDGMTCVYYPDEDEIEDCVAATGTTVG